MATRELPERTNPLLEVEHAPAHEILVERRCLGQTELKVKPGQVGTSNATKPDNLGTLDYAHLRVPLPKDLSGSGIFLKQANRKWPESYFLMRRSTDGFISATGMFKAAFPWAQQEEEAAEKDYIKNLEGTSSEEVAGNVWLHPEQALALADDYNIAHWITALLDPEPITHGTSDPNKSIQSPPAYRVADMSNGASKKSKSPTPKKTAGRKSVRGARSESPVKKTPARKIATPRKPRTTRRKAEAEAEEEAASVQGDAVNGEAPAQLRAEDKVKISVESATQPTVNGEDEVEQTKVNIEMPAGHPELELPDNPQDMLAQAKEMVDEANKLNGTSTGTNRAKNKRKADDINVDDDDAVGSAVGPESKRTKTVQLELRKERIKRRALTGIAASLAIGALVPSIMAAFGAS